MPKPPVCSLGFATLSDALSELLSHELPLNELLVGAISSDQLVVGSLLDDITLAKHDDLVRVHNG